MADLGKDWVTIEEACRRLSITRPTFLKLRKQENYKEIKIGRQIYIQWSEVISKVTTFVGGREVNVSVTKEDDAPIQHLKTAEEDTYDLRRIRTIDSIGIVSLLCHFLALSERAGSEQITLIVDNSYPCKLLEAAGFFLQLQAAQSNISWNQAALRGADLVESSVILPLTKIGYKGGERKSAELLADKMLQLGFGGDLSGYVAWVFGELGDNSLTHAKKAPCYLIARCDGIDNRYVDIAIGDTGVGIHSSLKSNPKHRYLSDSIAVFHAFMPKVSSWSDEHKRGLGLSDVFSIAMANGGVLRVEGGEHGFLMKFASKECQVQRKHVLTTVHGTRIGLLLVDRVFEPEDRDTVARTIEKIQGTL